MDFVRVYELDKELEISGNAYNKVGEAGVAYSATEFAGDVTYTWTVPEGASIASGQGTKDVLVDWGDTPGQVAVSVAGDITCPEEAVEFDVDFVADPEGDPYHPFDFDGSFSDSWGVIPGIVNEITLTDEADGSVRVDYTVENPDLNPQVYLPFALPLDLSEHQKLSVSLKGAGEAQFLRLQMQDVRGARTGGAPFSVRLPADDAFTDYAYIYATRWRSSEGSSVDSSKVTGVRILLSEGSGTFWVNAVALAKPLEGEEITGLASTWPAGWKLFPNPVAGETLTLQAQLKPAQLTLYDARGQAFPLSFQWNVNQVRMTLPGLPGGLYSLQVVTEEGSVFSRKLFIP
ncbi:MAG: T9SS type A sorting domain-containing protein [Bacteroidota bacterium]